MLVLAYVYIPVFMCFKYSSKMFIFYRLNTSTITVLISMFCWGLVFSTHASGFFFIMFVLAPVIFLPTDYFFSTKHLSFLIV